MKDELELVRRARQGDQAAFGRLVENHWARLVRMARSVTGPANAEDAVQEGLIRAWSKLAQLAQPASFGSWLSRVVLRVCLKQARSRPVSFIPLEGTGEPHSNPDPGAAIDVDRMLASLPPRQRAVMHLTVVEGMTDSEIAPVLGIAISSVRAHRHRARQRLGRQLRPRSVT